jgi:class 3 adenylate cyclase
MRVSRPRRYINAYFKELIDGIFQHAGDVIKFAGDAMQVVWRNRRNTFESLPQLVLRASVC